uniref:Uncharacterized protein n=1 Tax=Panagrolaimus davidi TaxID=227884 RepID=A0A914QAH8_9BILA
MDQQEPSTFNHLHQQEQQLQQQYQDLLQEESNNDIIISESSENAIGMSLIASTRQYSIGMGKNLKPNSRLWIETIEDPKLVHLYCLEESTDEKDTFFCKHCKRFNIITRCEILHFDGGATELWEVTTHLPSCKRQKTDVEKFSLGRPSAHGGSNYKPSVRISQRLQKKRESLDNGADEGVEDLSDKENNEYAEPILYHITPTVNRRKAAVSNPSLSTPASNSLPSLSNGTPVKPGSSISPQQNNKLAPRTEMDKRYDEERLRNLVIENPPSRNTPHPSENSSMNENSSVDYNQSLSLPDPNKSYMSLPSNYHEVLSNNWQYGYDSFGNPNKRIIVRDDKNPEDAHEYRNDRYDTRCVGCAKNGKVAAKIMNGTLYVPPSKDHTCEPRKWAEIQRLQREYKNNMGRKRGRTAKAETTVNKRAKVVE